MKATRKRIILLTALGIGSCALIADRLWGGYGNPPEPADVQTVAVTPSAPAAAVKTKIEPTALDGSFATRVRLAAAGVPPASRHRDVFRVPSAWSGIDTKVKGDSSPASPPSIPDPLRFQQAHRMTGVIMAGRRSSVMIDGKLLIVGQSIDGYRLRAIGKETARFEGVYGRAMLRLEQVVK